MPQHTSGPWEIRKNEPWIIAKDWGDLKSVVHLHYPVQQTNEQKANAQLMATAPELLETLEAVDRLLTFLGPCPEDLDDEDAIEATEKAVWMKIQKVINKAKGVWYE